MRPTSLPRSTVEERAELLRRAREGDSGAWEAIVDRFGGLVLSVARELGLAEDDCEEVFQNTWIAFFGQIDLIREPAAMGRWLVITAQRQAWRLHRRNAGRERGEGEADPAGLGLEEFLQDHGPSPVELATQLERRILVREALAELTAKCRDLLRRLYLRGDRTYAEVAEELGLPVGSIGPTRMRCMASLAAVLERRGF